ncbi:hypothetical protein [Catenuloplanes japonicus]|uniref:hypothetical protein n=1 Tax=Catenuloplanes japonicus TaxID=33876 RepID=UPI0005263114|nr:hypothetical protein [Catenuloplanes japonicus]
MDELDRLLAEAMNDAAGRAPSDDGLLTTVHTRSRQIHRRRVATALSAAAAVVVLGVPSVFVLTSRPSEVVPPADPVMSVSTSPSVPPSPTPSSSPSPSNTPSSAPPSSPSVASDAVTLTKGWTAPTFPYLLPPRDDLKAPVASLDRGRLVGFFETTDTRDHADVTVTVSGARPTFSDSEATETARQVRGHAGTLRTVDVSPAKQLALYWPESSGRWITLATDDTYTPDEVVALATSLTTGSTAALPPFQLAYSPAGLVTDTVTASRMTFRTSSAAPGSAGFSVVLRKRQQLNGTNQKIRGYDAALSHGSGVTTLAIDVKDWNATLEITVNGGLTISDADLLRFAGGAEILERSNPE